jgi:hypothetical protein
MRLRVKLGALAMAGGAAGLLVVGVPALASSHPASVKTLTGPEIIHGVVHGKAAEASPPRFLLTFQGLVYAGKVKFSFTVNPHPVVSVPEGKLAIQITGPPQITQQLNPRTCQATFAQREPIRVAGAKSTRVFAGASGPGAVQAYHAVTFGRFTSGPHKGQCNRTDLLVNRAVSSIIVSLVLTIRK